jgi:hypothetical protein
MALLDMALLEMTLLEIAEPHLADGARRAQTGAVSRRSAMRDQEPKPQSGVVRKP